MQQDETHKSADSLLGDIRNCTICEGLPLGPRPILQMHPDARLLIVGQAPGRLTHKKGVPFDDPSGKRLRQWLGVDREIFYNRQKLAIVPMGFCFPGTGKSGDLPPRPECEEAWRRPVLQALPNIELTIILGSFALDWHLGAGKLKTLTQTVQNWQQYWPQYLPLPHPSPRNIRWFKQNPWFEENVIPVLQGRVQQLL